MIKVTSEVSVVEVDGREVAHPVSVRVESHRNNSQIVVLIVNGVSYSVSTRHLDAAVKNATNTARF